MPPCVCACPLTLTRLLLCLVLGFDVEAALDAKAHPAAYAFAGRFRDSIATLSATNDVVLAKYACIPLSRARLPVAP
jgi:hypothetical protein